jgi:hypothetical protein
MSAAQDKRRARLRRLLADDPSLSDRGAAKALGCDHKTVSRDRARLADADGPRPPAPEHGNTRAVVHGATGKRSIAEPLQRHREELRRDYPALDDRRLALLAEPLARIEVAVAWLEAQDGLHDDKGRLYAVIDRLESWTTTAWKRLTDVEREARESKGAPADINTYLAQTYGGDDLEEDNDGAETT